MNPRFLFALLTVTKPTVTALVLVAAVSGMYIANGALSHFNLIFCALISIGTASAGAAALNNYIDRDIDLIMARTAGRVLPSKMLEPITVFWYGMALCFISLSVALLFINALTAMLTALTIFIYVVLYTMLTKRKTPIATFIGGVGGALPPVLGYTAIANRIDEQSITLFLIIYTWQHPHFWSVALTYIEEYRTAEVLNLPVVCGVAKTKNQITIWSILMAVTAILPYALGMAGFYYIICAIILATIHIGMAVRFQVSGLSVDMRLFYFSIIHLPVLYGIMILDKL